jgi:hypothetical protein
MKLMVESLAVFVLSLAAAVLMAGGEPAFAELAVADAAAAPVSIALLPGDAAETCRAADARGAPWLSP